MATLTVAVAAPSLHYDFVYDDVPLILERAPFWEVGLREFAASRPWGTGRHLAVVSLDLDRLEQGNVPLPFHRTNIALAALLSVLILVLSLRLDLSLAAATAATALFAVHPVHVDDVVSVVGRAELLMALGVVAALLACVRPTSAAPVSSWRVAAACALFATLALHSKESALCLPLLIVAARAFLGSRVAWIPGLVGSFVAIAGWLTIASALSLDTVQPDLVDNPLIGVSALERVPKALAILWQYAALLLWPHPLLADRSWAQTDPSLLSGWIAVVAWLAATIGVLRLARRQPVLAFALAWFPIAFAITGNVARPIGVLMAERFLLLPSVGACLALGVGVNAIVGRARSSSGALFAVVALVTTTVAVFFGLFRERAAMWKSPEVYFATSAAASPLSAKAQYDYGAWLLGNGQRTEAEAAFARALEIYPLFSRANYYLAESIAARKNPSGGADQYLRYLELKPEDAGAVTNVTRLLLAADRSQEALHWAKRAVLLSPGDSDVIALLVTAEGRARRAEKAAPKPEATDAAKPALP